MRIGPGKGIFTLFVGLSLAASLTACGGGGGDSGNSGTASGASQNSSAIDGSATSASANLVSSTPPVTLTPAADGKLHAACTSCGATGDSTYAGSGVGLWQALNASTQANTVNVSIAGTSGRNVTLVFTNEGGNQAILPVPIDTSVSTPSADMVTATLKDLLASRISEDPNMQAVREFNSTGWKALAQQNAALAASRSADVVSKVQRAAITYNIGDLRDFWLADGTLRHMALQAIGTTTDGSKVNIWVETAEYGAGKITPTIVDTLLRNYAGTGGVYDMVTGIGGPLWGAVSAAGMIGASQPIDLVVANFNHDLRPYGTVGYFWALNNFVNQGTGSTAHSNADLSLYLDSETLYLAGTAGMKTMQTVMAHESTHMQNFYRRDMLMGMQYTYDTWLEEMSAMMMEDWVSFNIDPTYNSVRDDRLVSYLTYNNHGSYTCGLTTWDAGDVTCDSYTTNGSFGGFLNRQLGLGFYKNLLNDRNATASIDILNDAIRQARADSSVAQELRHFTVAAAAQLPLAANFAQYSFASRVEGGFTLPFIDPSKMARALPSASPGVLLGYASFAAARSHVASTYQETVTLPPGVTLSVIVQ
ncbi:hemagglutinin [Paraburkholderia sp. DGU8]|uniref:M30 family zinc metallopeptidase n=1 Tax=Paraburkholderia sp. DGU8 TaxID=3161997 RepID=UPI003466904D